MKTILVIAFVTFVSFAFCQEKIEEGYVILNNGDTIKGGFISTKESSSPEKIYFKKNEQTITYSVNDLLEVKIGEKDYYKRFEIIYHLDAASLNEAKSSFTNKTERRLTLLKVVYLANYSLLKFTLKNRDYYYILTPKNTISELVYRVTLSDGNLLKDEQYKNQLIAIGNELELKNFSIEVEKITYSEVDLLKIVKLLNNNSGKSFYQKNKLEAAILGSINFNTFKSGGQPTEIPLTGTIGTNLTKFQSNVGLSAGILFNNAKSKKTNTIQPYLGLNFTYLKFNGSNYSNCYTYEREDYSGTTVLSELYLGTHAIVNKNTKNQIALGAYIGYNFELLKQTKAILKNTSLPTVELSSLPNLSHFLAYGFDLNARINSKARVGINYKICNDITNAGSSSLKLNSLSILYIYSLNKR